MSFVNTYEKCKDEHMIQHQVLTSFLISTSISKMTQNITHVLHLNSGWFVPCRRVTKPSSLTAVKSNPGMRDTGMWALTPVGCTRVSLQEVIAPNPKPWSCARQARAPAAAVQGLPALQPAVPYNYVLLHLWIITVTRRSVNLAIASAALTFTALQVRPAANNTFQ